MQAHHLPSMISTDEALSPADPSASNPPDSYIEVTASRTFDTTHLMPMEPSSPYSLSPTSTNSSTPHTSRNSSVSDLSSLSGVRDDFVSANDDEFIMNVGGLGYIGSHTSLELMIAGYNVVIVDDLSNSFEDNLTRIRMLATDYCQLHQRKVPQLKFHKADYRSPQMRDILESYAYHEDRSCSSPNVDGEGPDHHPRRSRISGIIHFAAFKSVGESIQSPLAYYQNNVCGLVDFLVMLKEFHIKTFVFSSSATVYGEKCNAGKPLREEDLVHHPEPCVDAHGNNTDSNGNGNGNINSNSNSNSNSTTPMMIPGALGHTSPYGRSKYFSEAILADVALADPGAWQIVALRYFNPVGCHESGLLGEDPRQIPTNLFPVLTQVLLGARPIVEVFGADWETPDGTAVRDFIHVVDLARGHVAALRAALRGGIKAPFRAYNLGSGRGSSVQEVINSIQEASSRALPVRVTGRRAGDVGSCVAATDRVNRELGWKTERSLLESARDLWNFISKSSAFS